MVLLALDTLGDLVLRQPLLSSLLDRGESVTIVVRRGYEEVVPHLDSRLDAIVADLNPHETATEHAWSVLAQVATEIEAIAPDVVVAAAHNRTYADEWILHRFAECRSIGFTNPDRPDSLLDLHPQAGMPPVRRRAMLFDTPVPCQVNDHELEKYKALYEAITGQAMSDRQPVLTINDDVRAAATAELRSMGLEPKQFAAGCPAGVSTVTLKAWPADQFAAVAEHLLRRHQLPTLLTGIPSEASLLNDVAAVAATRDVRLPVWIGGKGSLSRLFGLLSHSRVYVGNDTGTMHCAGALGIPVVARFGGGHWPRFVPAAERSFTATQQLPCFGCQWQCWMDTPACMTSIATATFTRGLDWILEDSSPARIVDHGAAIDDRIAVVFRGAADSVRRTRAELAAERDRTRLALLPTAHNVTKPKVFVVTPSYNQGRYLRETIESVLAQGYDNIEYFVADGGSTDDSVDILRSYGDRVRWTSGPDGGQAAAIARAWASSDADIVAWLNSDDTYLPGAIESAVEYLNNHPQFAMVYGDAWFTNAVGRRLRQYPTRPFTRDALAAECFICQPSTFIRREVFQAIDFPDPGLRYVMDYDLWIRLSQHFEVGYLPRFLATSRLHLENKSLGERWGLLREAMAIVQKHFGYVHHAWVANVAQERIARMSSRFSVLPHGTRRRLTDLIAHHLAGGVQAQLGADGWAVRRTLVPVQADSHGSALIECECPIWPYLGPLTIAASHQGRMLAVRTVRGPGRFTFALQLPPGTPRRTDVLLEANRSFLPAHHGLNTDPRPVCFRVVGVRPGSSESIEPSRGDALISSLSERLHWLPDRLERFVTRTLGRWVEQPVEGEPYPDGWLGPRTSVVVNADPSGRATLHGDCPVWPYRRPLRVSAYHGRRRVGQQIISTGQRFDLQLQLPPGQTGPTTVLLLANRSFVPRELTLSEDPRLLSFRLLGPSAAKHSVSDDDVISA